MGTDKESGRGEEQVESSILNQSVSLPHALNLMPGLSDEEALVYLLLIIHKAGFDLIKLAAGDISAASRGGVATDEEGYFRSPGMLVLAQAMGCSDPRAASVPLKHLAAKKVIACRAAGGLRRYTEICILALDSYANQQHRDRSFVGDGAQAGGSSIPLRLIFDPRLRLRLAPRLYALLLKCANGAEGVAFPATTTIAQLLSTKPATVRVVEAALVMGGYIAELPRGLQESKVRFFPKGRDVGNPAWSQLLGRCRYRDLFRAGILIIGSGGKLQVGDTSYANLCRLVAQGKLHPRAELTQAELAQRAVRAREAQAKSVAARSKNKVAKQVAAATGLSVAAQIAADVAPTAQPNSKLDLQSNSTPNQQPNDIPIHGLQPNSTPEQQPNSKPEQQPNSRPEQQENRISAPGLQPNSRLDLQANSNEVDSDSDSDKNSYSESESNIAATPVLGPLAEAHAIVRQLSSDYGDRADSNRTQLSNLWREYQHSSRGELTPELFLLMVKEVASYVRGLPAARVKVSRPAAFMTALSNNLHSRKWLKLKRQVATRPLMSARQYHAQPASRSVSALSDQPSVTVRVPPATSPVANAVVTAAAKADSQAAPGPTSEEQCVWQAAVDSLEHCLPEKAWRYFRAARLIRVLSAPDEGKIVYRLKAPASREGALLARLCKLDVEQMLAELTDCEVRLEVAN